MRILVVRPEPSASETAAKLQALGHDAVIFPMAKRICMANLNVMSLYRANGFVFTSANAIRCLAEHQLDTVDIVNKTAFCVGERTAELAREIGFYQVIKGSGKSSTLINPIKTYYQEAGCQIDKRVPLVYLTLEKRNPELEILLENSNIYLKTMIIYDIVTDYCKETLKSYLQYKNIEIVLFYAQSAVERFFANEPDFDPHLFTKLQYGCLSHEIANAIPGKYQRQIMIATKPEENCLLTSIGQ